VDREGDEGFFPLNMLKGDRRGGGLIFFFKFIVGGFGLGEFFFFKVK
jgi:hypothetical protein